MEIGNGLAYMYMISFPVEITLEKSFKLHSSLKDAHRDNNCKARMRTTSRCFSN